MRYEVRAMSFAEILDAGFRLVRDHFVLLVGISAALYVPVALFQSAVEALAKGQNPGSLALTGLLGVLIFAAVSPLVGVAITFALGEVYLGREVGIGDAFRKGLAIVAPVLGTSLLAGLAIVGASLLLILPGIWVGLGLMLLSPVMVLENRFGSAALRRSFELMKGQRLRAFGIALLVVILSSVLGFGVQMALGFIPIVGPIGSGLVSAVTGAYMAAIWVLLYFDIRCRTEAFEIEQLARLVESGSGGGREAVTPAAALGDESVRSLAREILARGEYARFRPRDAEWFESLARSIASAFEWLAGLWSTSPALYALLMLGLLAIAAALLAHVVWSVRRALSATPPPAPAPRAAEAPDLAAEGAALAREGRFLEAAHAMHLASLAVLLGAGALELRRHDPNRTLRRRLASAPIPEPLRRDFLALLGRLERRWFRDRSPAAEDPALFAAWQALHGRLAAAPRRRT